MTDILIVDYGLGNLRSVQKAFERVGFSAEVSSDPARLHDANKLVLPGVGAFRDASLALCGTPLGQAIVQHVRHGRPFLGICLGLQLLFSRGTEDGEHPGLGIFAGDVVRFPEPHSLKVPHMGWNTLDLKQPDCPLFNGLPANPSVYFVHSYFPVPQETSLIAATAEYPNSFCAAIWQGNTFATQFHPEKSQLVGLTILKNFASL